MKPQELVVLQQNIVQITAALHGDFDKEIKALGALMVDWDKRRNIDKEIEAVKEARSRLEADKSVAIDNAAKISEQLQQKQDELVAYEKRLAERAKKLAADETRVLNATAQLEQERAAGNAALTAMTAQLEAKMKSADDLLADLTARAAAVAQRENNMKAAMKQVGTLVQ